MIYFFREIRCRKRRTVFPEVQRTLMSAPLTSKTSPSIQATTGSSTQTSDPTPKPTEAAYKSNNAIIFSIK